MMFAGRGIIKERTEVRYLDRKNETREVGRHGRGRYCTESKGIHKQTEEELREGNRVQD